MPIVTVICALLAVLAGIGSASATPQQLYGKGIRIQYVVASTVVTERGPREVVSNITRTIYISRTGRLFERAVWSNSAGTKVSENSPGASTNVGGEARGMSFHGSDLVAHIGYASGAGQMTIRFDPTFSSCEGTMVFGTERGGVMARRGLGGEMRQIVSIKASNLTCSVTSGNPLQ